MSKYKVGDKFIIEIAEVYENVLSGVDVFEAATSEPLYRIKGFNSLVFDKNGLDRLEEVPDKKNFIAPDNIRVGDVVTVGDRDIKFICTKDNASGDYSRCHLLSSDGSVWKDCKKSDCKRIGKNVKIGDLLEKINRWNARSKGEIYHENRSVCRI